MTTTVFALTIFIRAGFGGFLMADFRTMQECMTKGPVVAQALAGSMNMPVHWTCNERKAQWGDV